MQIINQYSAIWIGVFLVAIAGSFLFRHKQKWPGLQILGLLVIALVTVWIILHPRQSLSANDPDRVLATIGQGTPILLEFQSPY